MAYAPISKVPQKGSTHEFLQYGGMCLEEGNKFLERQPGYDLIQPCIDRVLSKKTSTILSELERPNELATTTSNRMKKIMLELVANMTDIKPFWEIKTYNPYLDKSAENFSKLSTSWYTRVSADQIALAQALRYACVSGIGYVWLEWDPEREEIMPKAPDPRDVIPIRPDGEFLSIQNSRGVIIREEYTLAHAKILWPDKSHLLVTDHDALDGTALESTRAGKVLAQVNVKAGSPLDDALFSSRPRASIGAQPAVWVYTMYIMDRERNEETTSIEMGEFKPDPLWVKPEGLLGLFSKPERVPANNWSYVVKPGEKKYPRGRRVTFTRTAILEDIPNPYWFAEGGLAKFPIAKLTLDPFPKSWFGLIPLGDLLPLQDSLDWNLRVIDDHNAQVAQPPIFADSYALGKNALTSINTRRAGLKVLSNPMGKPPMIIPVPALESIVKEHVQWVKEEMEDLVGLGDMKNLLSLNQLPNTETIERLIESKTYLLQARSRSIEGFMREFALILISMFAQFYTIRQRYQLLGPSGSQPEDFDFDPANLVPDFVHATDFDDKGNLTPEAKDRGPLPAFERFKEIQRQLTFMIAPGSLLNASSVTKKLLYLTLFQIGLIDPWTLAEQLDIPGFGEPPAGANTIPEKIAAAIAMGIMPSPGGPSGPGRPNEFSKMPNEGDNGSGSTIRTS